ncbi:MAG: thioredoxin domain-containing protein [Cyanobacteria bacterium P01_H01_bin.119]
MALSTDETSFSSDVLESYVPVLVNFWAPWCGLCRIIEPLLQSFQNEWGGQVRVVGINADENLKLTNFYRLKTLPTLLLIHQGQLVRRIDSFRGRDDLRQTLDAIMRSPDIYEYWAAHGQIPILPNLLPQE